MSAKISGLADLTRKLAAAASLGGVEGAAGEAGTALRAAAERQLGDVAPGEAARVIGALRIEVIDGSHIRLHAHGARAAALEFGAMNRPARPWLEPALRASREAVTAAFARWLKSSIKGTRS